MPTIKIACLPLIFSLVAFVPAAYSADAPSGGVADEEPQITIIQRGSDVIEEYRLQGRLYMIKVIPKKGLPYFLVDTDGDGNLDTRRSEMTEDLLIPSWTLFQWK